MGTPSQLLFLVRYFFKFFYNKHFFMLYHKKNSCSFSGGPKNYAYRTATGKTSCKVRGFTLNFRNTQLLNFESIKNLVCSFDPSDSISLCNPQKITREAKRRKVINREETKMYRVVYDKRVIQQDLSTLPYGY